MLSELTITDFAIIDHLQLSLPRGLSVLTGETGAGKSIIIDAVSLLLGGRADAECIRTGTQGARVEGIFQLPPALAGDLDALLAEQGLQEEGGQLILAREINRSGRNVCRINGRAVPLSLLSRLGELLVDIHGQSEHLSLLRVREHLDFLDRYANLESQRAQVADGVSRLRRVREEIAGLRQDEHELARRADLLQYQVHEIKQADLQADEEEQLQNELRLLQNAERLSSLANDAFQALAGGGDEQRAVCDLLDAVLRSLSELERLDPKVAETRKTAEEASYTLDDLARTLRAYRDGVEFDPVRLETVQDRLELIRNLKRKYGNSVAEVLSYAQDAAQQLHAITHNEERLSQLAAEETRLLAEVGTQAAALSSLRREAGQHLAEGVEAELHSLSMPQARFVVDILSVESADGLLANGKQWAFDASGIDHVEFLISPNVGEPPKPLAKIASGGETSRLMLALKTVLSAADHVPTLIFDEIDQGIGGRVGGVVGRKLHSLTPAHQVLCVTHLPQLAAYADTHFQVDKAEVEGRTVTRLRSLEGEERIDELAAMLGGPPGKARRRSAEEIYAETLAFKSAQPKHNQ